MYETRYFLYIHSREKRALFFCFLNKITHICYGLVSVCSKNMQQDLFCLKFSEKISLRAFTVCYKLCPTKNLAVHCVLYVREHITDLNMGNEICLPFWRRHVALFGNFYELPHYKVHLNFVNRLSISEKIMKMFVVFCAIFSYC